MAKTPVAQQLPYTVPNGKFFEGSVFFVSGTGSGAVTVGGVAIATLSNSAIAYRAAPIVAPGGQTIGVSGGLTLGISGFAYDVT